MEEENGFPSGTPNTAPPSETNSPTSRKNVSFMDGEEPTEGAASNAEDTEAREPNEKNEEEGGRQDQSEGEEKEEEEEASAADAAALQLLAATDSDKNAVADADKASVAGRHSNFVAFNPWAHDVAHAQQMEELNAVELGAETLEIHKKLETHEENNFAKLKYYDVCGYNFDSTAKEGKSVSIVAHAEDDSIVFAAGRHITTTGITTTERRMMLRTPNVISIHALCVSSNGKYVAVSERLATGPHVAVYKLDTSSRVVSLNFKFLCKTQIVGLSFSSNNNFLATISAAPDQKLFIWQLDDTKVIGMGEIPPEVDAVSINPWESMHSCTSGGSHFFVWKIADRKLSSVDMVQNCKKGFFENTTPNFTAHCWYDEDCVAGLLKEGALAVVEQFEMKEIVPIRVPENVDNFTQLQWASRGLLVGCSGGVIILLDRTYSFKTYFVQIAVFHTSSPVDIRAMSVSPAELNIVVALSNNSIEYLLIDTLNDAIERLENYQEGDSDAAADEEDQSKSSSQPQGAARGLVRAASKWGKFGGNRRAKATGVYITERLFSPIPHAAFNNDTITSLSLCVQRPIVMTTGAEGCVRIYDYERHICLVHTNMSDEVLAGALHPIGLYCVLCFRFYTRIFAIVKDELVLMAEIPLKAAHEVRFAQDGGRFSLTVMNRVFIYDTHSYEFLGMLVGHTHAIKSVAWSHKDTIITTSDQIGMIICWETVGFKRMGLDSSQKNLIFQCATYHEGTSLVAAVGTNKHARGKIFEGEFTVVCCMPNNDETLVYVRPGMVLPKQQALRKLHCNLIAISKLSQTLFVGTPTGRVLLYTWPLVRSSKPYDYVDAHNGEILHLALTREERYLITVSADHTMYIYLVDQMKDGKYVTVTPFQYSLFDGVKFELMTDSLDRERRVSEQRKLLKEQSTEYSVTIEKIRTEKEAELKTQCREYEQEIDTLKKQCDKAANELQVLEKKAMRNAEKIEAVHIHAAEEIENLYNKKTEASFKNYLVLQAEKDELVVKYETKLAQVIEAGEQQRIQLEQERKERERQLGIQLDGKRKLLRDMHLERDAILCQQVVDYEEELHHAKAAYTSKMVANEELVFKATTTASYGDREAERLKKELRAIISQIQQKETVIKEGQEAADRKQKENEQLKIEMRTKQEAINVAEKKMQSSKQQLTVLENLRFVLTHQFEELRGEVVPKDLSIRKLEQQLVDMELTLQSISVERNAISEQVGDIDERITRLTDIAGKLRVQAIDKDRKKKLLHTEMERLISTYREPKSFAKKVRVSLEEAKKSFGDLKADDDGDAQQMLLREFEQNDQYLRALISHTTQTNNRSTQLLREKNCDQLVENGKLIQEIKGLRQERKILQTQCSNLELQLRDVRMSLHGLLQQNELAIAAGPVAVIEESKPAPSASRSKSPAKQTTKMLLPPIESELSIGQSSRTVTPVNTERKKPVSGGSSRAETGVSIQKEPPSSSLGKKESKTTEKTRSQLEAMLEHLDANTHRMRAQQKEVESLRIFVNDLLRREEMRLMGAMERNLTSMSHNTTTAGVTPGPVLSEDNDSPDWTVAEAANDGARPMTPTQKPPGTGELV